MKAKEKVSEELGNFAYLQSESLAKLAPLMAVIGYCWYWWLIRPRMGPQNSVESWVGSSALLISASVSFILREKQRQASSLILIWGTIGSAVCLILLVQTPSAFYLLVPTVILAYMLCSKMHAFATVLLIEALILALTHTLPDMSILSRETGLVLACISFVAIVCGIHANNLHTALSWAWHGYENARQKEKEVRDRQIELRRTLRALDDSSHRLERTNYMLAQARDQAEEAQRLKQQFAQTISHELCTPLNLIVGFTDLMLQSPHYYRADLAPTYARDLSIVHRNARHLQSLVEDVLDLARIEAAQMSVIPEETDPAQLVLEVVKTSQSLIQSRGLELCTHVESDLPNIWVDPTRIRQVLFNLLNNAARHTTAGTVTVSVRRQEDALLFSVTDTGEGIAQDDIPRLFREFQRLGDKRSHEDGGAGLGLVISKRFIELHKGRIWVESQLGKGSTFTFSLPAGDIDLVANLDSHPVPRQDALRRQRDETILLLVTDSRPAAVLLTRHINNCRTIVVHNLEEARKAANELVPQAVVIDAANSEISSGDLEGLGEEWGLAHTLFVVCPLPAQETANQPLAVDGYLIKPVSQQSLWDLLRQYGDAIDRVLLVDHDHDFVRLLSRMLDSPVRRYQVVRAFSGSQGLEMMRYHQPDLVLVASGLSDMDAPDFVEHVRANAAWQHIPIIAILPNDENHGPEKLGGPIQLMTAGGFSSTAVTRYIEKLLSPNMQGQTAHEASDLIESTESR